MNTMSALLHVPALFIVVILPIQLVMSGYQPIRTQTADVNFNETGRGKAFPDYNSNSAMCSLRNGDSYFGNELNFVAIPRMIITGAADQLFLLNQELGCQDSFFWNTTTDNFVGCTQAGIEESACRNHIRVYKKFPSQSSILLVCGTQGGISPQCRTLNVSGNVLTSMVPASSTVPASDSLISSYPEFNWFGEFIDSTDKFFSSGYYRGNRQLGRDLNITFHSVSYSPTNGSLTLRSQFGAKDDLYWLNLPVTLVDYYSADYPTSPPELYQFYFVFLREVLVGLNGLEIIYSRVARICRNDPGINGHFSTYMKARIFCEREVPPGRQFNGAVDYHYNEIQSLVFNDVGRYGEGGPWVKMMYGAFSGPTIGPPGTAICAYRADNSLNTGGTGFNRGIFDIFREDLTVVNPDGTTAERENTFVECRAGGRTSDFNNVLSVQDVSQIGEDPLVVFDGLIVTKMALDQVCVVTRSDSRRCQNQDILFLGTDTGKIMKVVFSISGSQPSTFDPIVAEEITLDSDSNEAVKELHIVNDDASNERYIYAATESRVYRLPLQRCSRLQRCNECIGSRDPYCVWNSRTNEVGCQANPLSASGSNTADVLPNYWQSIHTGSVTECSAAPVCEVTVRAISADTIICEAECTNTMSITFSSNIPEANGLRTCGGQSTSPTLNTNTGCVQFSGSIGLHSYMCTVEARPENGSSVNFTQTTITPAGPPACIDEQDIIHFIGQRDVTVCINLDVLTDHFENYGFEVDLNGKRRQNFTDGNCLKIDSLTPGSSVNYMASVFNSIPSSCTPVSVSINLLEDKPGPVGDLQVTPGNVSATILWSPPDPSIRNGLISGYAIYLDGSVVVNCALLNSSYTTYTISGLIPYTEYTVGVKACTTAGEGSPNSTQFQTLCGSPSRVENLNIVVVPGVPGQSLNVTWEQPTQLNGNPSSIQYVVIYTCYLPSSPRTMQITTNNLYFTIAELVPLTNCHVDVYAKNTCNSVTYSGPVVNVHSRTGDGTPSPVENLAAIVVSDHSLFVTWEPPQNYERPGLNYSVNVAGRASTVSDQTYLFVNTGLEPNTSYEVVVKAVSSVGMSAETTVMKATKLSLPSPPSNIQFLAVENNGLPLEWTAQSHVANYTVFWKCNEMDGNITTTYTAIMINNSVYSGSSYTWCTARVQSANEVGLSDLSAAVSTVIPQSVPPPPTCFLVDNQGSSALFSFTVSTPFSLNELNISWQLNTSSTTTMSTNTLRFVNNSLTILVERNTEYIFSLRLCNLQGCGDYCPSIEFTTNMNPPQAPTNLNATNITHSSAVISWDLPANEDQENVRYTVEVTSSCQSGNILQKNFGGNTLSLTELCSGKLYSFVVQATAIVSNVTGPLSRPYTFMTAEGIPSRPRDVQLQLTEKMLTIQWAEPVTTNGVLTHYEVLWYRTNINNCDNAYKACGMDRKDCNFTNTVSDQHNTTFIVDTILIESILVCVRAYTNAGMGEWGSYYNGTVKTGGLATNEEQDCNGLIIVAVIASIAVISSITMGSILAIIMCKTKDTLFDSSATKKFEEKPLPPDYDRTASMQSTKSLIGHDS